MARKFLWGSLVAHAARARRALRSSASSGTVAFVLAAAALVPLAWLIGEATEHVAEHTGPGIGGFVNASFGNAPELIIALFAIRDGLPNVVRGSIAGSVVSNLLLVLGGGDARRRRARELDRRSTRCSSSGSSASRWRCSSCPSIPGLARGPRAPRRSTW